MGIFKVLFAAVDISRNSALVLEASLWMFDTRSIYLGTLNVTPCMLVPLRFWGWH